MAVPDSATPERAFRLEPYSYLEVRALMEALGLAEPVAVTLVRRGHRTVDEACAFLEATEVHDPFEFGSNNERPPRKRRCYDVPRDSHVREDDCDLEETEHRRLRCLRRDQQVHVEPPAEQHDDRDALQDRCPALRRARQQDQERDDPVDNQIGEEPDQPRRLCSDLVVADFLRQVAVPDDQICESQMYAQNVVKAKSSLPRSCR